MIYDVWHVYIVHLAEHTVARRSSSIVKMIGHQLHVLSNFGTEVVLNLTQCCMDMHRINSRRSSGVCESVASIGRVSGIATIIMTGNVIAIGLLVIA